MDPLLTKKGHERERRYHSQLGELRTNSRARRGSVVMTSSERRGGALLVLVWALAGRGALAQSSSEDAARAEMLFREGRTLVKAGKAVDACPKFAESHRLDPQVGTLLNLALCHEEVGKSASAWAEFNEVAERAAGARERSEFAHWHARALEAKLSRLRLRVEPAILDLSLRLDGRPVGPGAIGSLIPLDPGEHSLEATAPGRVPWTAQVQLAPGPSTAEVVVNMAPELAPAPADVRESPPRAPPPPQAPLSSEPRSAPLSSQPGSAPLPAEIGTGHGSKSAGIVVTGLGVAAIGTGAIFGLKAFSKKAEKDDLCPRGCDNPNYDLAVKATSDSKTYAAVSTLAFGVGAAALATGVYLLFAPPLRRTTTSAARLTPQWDGSTAGLAIHGPW